MERKEEKIRERMVVREEERKERKEEKGLTPRGRRRRRSRAPRFPKLTDEEKGRGWTVILEERMMG